MYSSLANLLNIKQSAYMSSGHFFNKIFLLPCITFFKDIIFNKVYLISNFHLFLYCSLFKKNNSNIGNITVQTLR